LLSQPFCVVSPLTNFWNSFLFLVFCILKKQIDFGGAGFAKVFGGVAVDFAAVRIAGYDVL
jgi:hypothetical protein